MSEPIASIGVSLGPALAAFRKLGERAKTTVRETVRDVSVWQQQRTFDLCPKDTEFMANHIFLAFDDDEFGYTLGWRASDFADADLPPYYFWQELGFRHHLSGKFIRNPSLQPAHLEAADRLRRELPIAIRAATQGVD